jgi:Protein of unknown function (DUF4238)
MSKSVKQSGRRDHYLPQSYLRGFILPSRQDLSRPLWVLYPQRSAWREMNPTAIGYGPGFYDPMGAPPDHIPADDVFARLENGFPAARRALIDEDFRNIEDHLEFLVQYVNMLRARSPLFFAQLREAHRNDRLATILSVDETGKKLTIDEVKPAPDVWIRNRPLAEMREEIEKGSRADWVKDLNWCVRTATESLPVITAQHALIYVGPKGTRPESRDAIFYFPISWQACLVGARFKWQQQVAEFGDWWLSDLHKRYFANEREFIVSPKRLGPYDFLQ